MAHCSCLVSVHFYKVPDLTTTVMACVSAGSWTLCDAPCPVVLERVTLSHDEIYQQQARAWLILEPDWEAVSGSQAVKGSDPIHNMGVATSTTKGKKVSCASQALSNLWATMITYWTPGLSSQQRPWEAVPGMWALFWEEQNKQLGSLRWRRNVLCLTSSLTYMVLSFYSFTIAMCLTSILAQQQLPATRKTRHGYLRDFYTEGLKGTHIQHSKASGPFILTTAIALVWLYPKKRCLD